MYATLTELVKVLKDKCSKHPKHTETYTYNDKLIAIDFNVDGVRIAFDLIPIYADGELRALDGYAFSRDVNSSIYKAFAVENASGKRPVGIVENSISLADDICANVFQALALIEEQITKEMNLTDKTVAVYAQPVRDAAQKPERHNTSDAFTIQDVIARDICIGCGACSVITGGLVKIEIADNGMNKASMSDVDALSPALLQKANSVCPFSDLAANEDELGAPSSRTIKMEHDDRLGSYLAIMAGRENNDEQIVGSSSGGLTSWMVKKLLESNRVDGVIHVGNMSDSDRLFGYRISFSTQEIDAHRKSFYYSTTLSDVLEEAKKYSEKSFAIIGVPCFIKAARLLANEDPDLGNLIKYYIGIVCGHMKSSQFAEANAWQLGTPPDDIEKVDFRVKQPNKPSTNYQFSVVGKTDKKLSQLAPAKILGGNWGHSFFQPNACNYCDDIFAETADAVFGDAWIPRYKNDWRGTNVIALRNQDLVDVFQEGVTSSEVNIDNISLQEIVGSQAGGFRHRREGLRVRLQDDLKHGFKVPAKRTPAGYDDQPEWRIQLIRQRKRMSELSFKHFSNAKKTGNLSDFLEPMKDQTKLYQYLEAHKYPNRPKNKYYDAALFCPDINSSISGSLVTFALSEILAIAGLSSVVVSRDPKPKTDGKNLNVLENFVKFSKFRPVGQLHELRAFCDHFVLAPLGDTVKNSQELTPEFSYLGAGDSSVNRISMATQLTPEAGGDAITTYLLNEMDHVSAGDPESLSNLENIGVKGIKVIDPLFLCPKTVFKKLLDYSTIKLWNDAYVLGFFSTLNDEASEFASSTSTFQRGLIKSVIMTDSMPSDGQVKRIEAGAHAENTVVFPNSSIADLIVAVSQSDFVHTDNIYAACIAVIFNKPFICTQTNSESISLLSLLDELGLRERIVVDTYLSYELVNQPINWSEVNRHLKTMRQESLNWLEVAFGKSFSNVEKLHF